MISFAGVSKQYGRQVLFVDASLPIYSDRFVSGRQPNPYYRAEQDAPATATSGVPVVILSDKAAAPLASAYGLDPSLLGQDEADAWKNRPSVAHDLGVTARVVVPLERKTSSATSYIGEVDGVAHQAGHVLIWAPRHAGAVAGTDVLSALAGTLAARHAPFIFVDFDESGDPRADTQVIRTALGDRRISLVIVLGNLKGDALKFTTPNGDLIPALDLYARQAGARAIVTQSTAALTALDGIAPFVDVKSVLVDSAGGDGDLRPDAAAFVGYLAGRLALGGEELPK